MALPPGLRAVEGQSPESRALCPLPRDPLPTPRPPVTSTYPVISPADKVDNASALESWCQRLYQSQY